jgi:predicted anti-sigma-YlaC factor YlaD
MKCQAFEKKLSAYQDGELAALEREQVERHLSVCHSCREQHLALQQTWQALGEMTEIRPTPGFYKRLAQKIGPTSKKRFWGSCWENWGVGALPSTITASVILAIGIICGTYIGNSLIRIEPLHSAAAFYKGDFLSSLRVFDPVAPGTLAESYERLLSYNESHVK